MPGSCWFCCPAFALPGSEATDVRSRATALANTIGCTAEFGAALQAVDDGPWPPAPTRARDLAAAWDHDYLWPLRGGSGCLHLLDTLAERHGRAPMLLGYSDITVLHAWWFRNGWGETCYTAMAGDRQVGDRTLATLRRCLDGSAWTLDGATGGTVIAPGEASGPSFVACLRVLTTTCGTPAQPDLRGCVLFLEDVDERPYAIDRDLWQLWHAGLLRGIAGLVVSNFPGERPPHDLGPELPALWAAWAARLGVPLIMGLPFGHEADAHSLPVGRTTTLSATADDTWSLGFAARD